MKWTAILEDGAVFEEDKNSYANVEMFMDRIKLFYITDNNKIIVTLRPKDGSIEFVDKKYNYIKNLLHYEKNLPIVYWKEYTTTFPGNKTEVTGVYVGFKNNEIHKV